MHKNAPASAWFARHIRSLLAIAWILLVAVSAVAVTDAHDRGRADLEERSRLRVELVAKFVDSYVDDFLNRERRTAQRQLAAPAVSRSDFESVVALFGLEAAVLLDGNGKLLHVLPSAPQLIGSNLSREYAHLRTATEGRPAVSDVVFSAAGGAPVVEFAVPFSASGGRRVFSGAFDVADTPFAAYVAEAVAVAPNRSYLVDSDGLTIATNAPATTVPAIPDAVNADTGALVTAFRSANKEYVATTPIPGTPWRLALAAPEANLYQPVDGIQRWVPWLLWLGFAAGGLICVLLVGRLIKGREELHRLARIDGLTGLANRTGLDEALASALGGARRIGHRVAVLLIDIDDFKTVNDSHGHAVGDDLLRLVADCINAQVRANDVVGRWGGDEFLVVMAHTATDGPEAVCRRLHECVERTPLVIAGMPVSTTISVGCASSDGDEDATALVARADQALYRAKAGGRDQFAVDEFVGARATTADSEL